MNNRVLLKCDNLSVGYGARVVADRISFQLEAGSYLGIVGPNGCGKTTLLKTILGIIRLQSGSLAWAGGRAPRMGYVPQRDTIDAIYPFQALDVVLLALDSQNIFRPVPSAEAKERARRALETAGLGAKYNKSYSELSGGERQRVLLARALAMQPEVLALDEPTNGLDPGGAEQLLDVIAETREKDNLTIILVSHDLSLVARRATHALAMFNGKHIEGEVRTTLTTENLSELYQYPLVVKEIDGTPTVVPHYGAERR
ncbi:MAG: metal ABC transporter ATP-binding protein [Planctomycetota bacterium]